MLTMAVNEVTFVCHWRNDWNQSNPSTIPATRGKTSNLLKPNWNMRKYLEKLFELRLLKRD